MSDRIDLTQEVLREKLYDWMTKGYEPQMAIPDDLPNEITEILYCIEHLGLLAELKRCYEHIDTLTAIRCSTCEKQFGESDYGINYHRITVPDDSLVYEYREDMQEHCIECMETSEAIEKNCICDLCQQYHKEQPASE